MKAAAELTQMRSNGAGDPRQALLDALPVPLIADMVAGATEPGGLHKMGSCTHPDAKVIAAAVAGIPDKVADGKPLVSGKTETGFTNTEEEGVALTNVVSVLVEDMLKANGGMYEKGADWASFVVIDGKLATEQNPVSSQEAARKLLDLL